MDLITGAYHDMVVIAREEPTWNCANIRVYLLFKFAAHEKRVLYTADETDILNTIEIKRASICLI
jgi:hypothetical protein